MKIEKKIPWVVIITVLAIFAALFVGFKSMEKTLMEKWYQKLAFYFLLGGFAMFIQRLLPERFSDIRGRDFFRKHWIAILVAATIISCGLLTSTPDFRILADEINLLGMSMAMHDHHKTYNPTQLLYYFCGMQRLIEKVTDMRPAFYPFLVSLCHSAFGYSANNGFVLNAFAGFLILLFLYLILEKRWGKFWGLMGMSLLGAFPLFVLYFTSCGFETVNLLFALVLVYLLDFYLENPRALNAERVFLVLPLLGQTRYESVLSVFVVIPAVLYVLPREEYFKFSWRLIIIPFLFIPIVWLRIITYSSQAFQVASVDKAFGFDLFVKNLRMAVPFFFGQSKAYGMIPLVAILAVGGFIWLLYDFVLNRKQIEKKNLTLLVSIFGLIFVHGFARFYYYWGNMTLQYTSRLGLIFLPFIVFLALYVLMRFNENGMFPKSWMVAGVILLSLHGWPVAGRNLGVRDIFFFREFKAVRSFLDRNYPDKENFVLVTELSNLYIPFRYSAVRPSWVNLNRDDFLNQLKRRTYNTALVVQKFAYPALIEKAETRFNPPLELKKLFDYQLHAGEFLRISEIALEPILSSEKAENE